MEALSLDPLAVLRVLCGVWFIPHCIGKVRNIGPASQTFAKAGLHPARAFVVLTIVVEVIAGLGLVLNIYPQVAAALAAGVLAGASYAVLKINGFNWRWQKQGPEFMVFWAVAALLSVSG
ncbi:putative oxidoreductase [Pseudomonas benzenivorans]|nr:DoxX family protein [Pseudomonas benzenivorans]SDH29150.1 putative oxidoreductase [Pseudomonas benzenivorans]